MNQRIREFLSAENKSSAQLAEEIGVQPSGISHILSGRNKPSLDFILKMLDKYPSLSTDWLLFGKGTMYAENKSQSLFDELIDNNEDKANKGYQEKPLKSVSDEKETLRTEIYDDLPAMKHATSHTVKKIVWFYSDNSFEEYFPEK